MIIYPPTWISHLNDKGKKCTLYSLHFHPTRERLATAGQDCKVKIWNTKPLFDSDAEQDESIPKLVSTLDVHIGAVLAVRWSNRDGRLLASGSDDTKIIIWKMDESGVGLGSGVFGGHVNERNHEVYRPIKVLLGHSSDVADLSWSPDNEYLASCGFDSVVIIWETASFDKVKVLNLHAGFVKGLTWDPVGQYLASQSDDKSIKIWRVSDWGLEKEITEPYEAAASTTFFRRLCWSPEGSCIVTANGSNGGMPTAPVISRNGWKTEISLIGHRAPIEVAIFNPVLFKIGDKEPKVTAVCAIGSTDTGLSIWWTGVARSPLAASNLFPSGILDMSWSSDGYHLVCCSFDGSVQLLSFEPTDLGQPVTGNEKLDILTNYGYKKSDNIVAESYQQLLREFDSKKVTGQTEKQVAVSSMPALPSPSKSQVSFAAPITPVKSMTTEQVVQHQKVSQTKDGKKRITPMFVRSLDEPAASTQQPLKTNESVMEASTMIPMASGIKRKLPDSQDTRTTQEEPKQSMSYVLPTILTSSTPPALLGVPRVQNKLRAQLASRSSLSKSLMGKSEPANVNIECTNSAVGGARVVVGSGKDILWEDKIPYSVIRVCGSEKFIVVACASGHIFTYSPAGRRILSPIFLEAPACFLDASGPFLMVLTALGNVFVWNIDCFQNILYKESLGHFLDPTDNSPEKAGRLDITHASLLPHGVPKINLSDGRIFCYHLDMRVWISLPKYDMPFFNSDDGSLGPNAGAGRNRTLILKAISELESQLCAHLATNNPIEYRQTLKKYAQKLADDVSINKVEELCDDLIGGTQGDSFAKDINLIITDDQQTSAWSSTVLGIPKRELLKEILPVFGSNRHLQRVVQLFEAVMNDNRIGK